MIKVIVDRKKINLKLKYDRYQKKRGKPKILLLICSNCREKIALYQKDGPGWLKRCYLDRIYPIYTFNKINLNQKFFKCQKCGQIFGEKIIFKKEKRLAFKIDRNNILRKKLKLLD